MPSEVAYIIEDGQAKLIMSDEAFVTAFLTTVGAVHAPSVRKVLCTERTRRWGCRALQAGYEDHGEGLRRSRPARMILHCSSTPPGTTGSAQGHRTSHRGMLSTSARWRRLEVRAEDVFGNPLPTFHVAGMTMLLLTLYTGGLTHRVFGIQRGELIKDIARHASSRIRSLVPAMLLFMLQQPGADEADYRTLKLIAYGGSTDHRHRPAEAMRGVQVRLAAGVRFDRGLRPADLSDAIRPPRRRLAARTVAVRRQAGRWRAAAHRRPGLTRGSAGGHDRRGVDRVRAQFARVLAQSRSPRHAYPEGRNERGGWLRTGDGGYLKGGYPVSSTTASRT